MARPHRYFAKGRLVSMMELMPRMSWHLIARRSEFCKILSQKCPTGDILHILGRIRIRTLQCTERPSDIAVRKEDIISMAELYLLQLKHTLYICSSVAHTPSPPRRWLWYVPRPPPVDLWWPWVGVIDD